MIFCDNLDFYLEKYDGFLVDIWGTLYNGDQVTPAVISFLEKLKGLSKKVVLFSNSPRLSGGIQEDLSCRGLPSSLYQGILTSGDDVFEHLSHKNGIYKNFGKTFFHMGSPRHVLWEETSFRAVSFLQEASFILATGFIPGRYNIKEYSDLFTEALMLDLPFVCAHTDRFMIVRGSKIWCAGKLGEVYSQLEGEVYWHGKPQEAFFERALGLFEGIPRERVLVIGDGAETDILGANKMSLDSVFIANGLCGEVLKAAPKGPPFSSELLKSFLKGHHVTPTYVLPFLQ